jgi:hypothetical protein
VYVPTSLDILEETAFANKDVLGNLERNRLSDLNATASLLVTCTSYYVTSTVGVELQIDDNFDATQTIESPKASVSDNVRNLTDSFENYLVNCTEGFLLNLKDGIKASDFALPTLPFAFDLEVPEIPETHLKIRVDDTELYFELSTMLYVGATYQINLYTSSTPVGISIGTTLRLGVVAALDLILSVETVDALKICTGFHIKLEDGIVFDIALFGDRVSNMIL